MTHLGHPRTFLTWDPMQRAPWAALLLNPPGTRSCCNKNKSLTATKNTLSATRISPEGPYRNHSRHCVKEGPYRNQTLFIASYLFLVFIFHCYLVLVFYFFFVFILLCLVLFVCYSRHTVKWANPIVFFFWTQGGLRGYFLGFQRFGGGSPCNITEVSPRLKGWW